MRERAALLGGTFEAGPTGNPASPAAKVWAVHATLPAAEGEPA
jgi:hypothetical protein